MSKAKKVFIVGWGGSGTRVISQILKRAGYNIGKQINQEYDYLPILVNINDAIGKKTINSQFKKQIKALKEPFAIKHGQMMMCIEQIKKEHPDSFFILVVRHGVDNVLKDFRWEESYGKHFIDNIDSYVPLEGRMMLWVKVHELALKHSDYTIRLEDIVDRPEKEIGKLFKALNFKGDPQKYCDIVKRPGSIGRRCSMNISGLTLLGKSMLERLGYE